MRFNLYFSSILIALTLTACQQANVRPIPEVSLSTASQSERSLVAQAVLGRLKDPDSAKFGEVILSCNHYRTRRILGLSSFKNLNILKGLWLANIQRNSKAKLSGGLN